MSFRQLNQGNWPGRKGIIYRFKDEGFQKSQELEKLRKQMTKKQDKERPLGTSRGVETMFRNASRANYQLIAFADNKASIMITVNGFILSVLMASLGNTYNQDSMVGIAIVLIYADKHCQYFYSVLAAYPRVPDKKNIHTGCQGDECGCKYSFFWHLSQYE